ncbi:MAG: S9 family peptidase [Bacteroidales bacterium]|nr:S9 family peptidase [Bacteroidales bacterium]
MKKSAFLVLTIVITGLLSLKAADLQVFDPHSMWEMKRPGSPVVSPDGEWSVFALTTYDIDESRSSSNLFLLNNASAEVRQVTFSGSDSGPAWSPDGKKIAFVSRRHDGPGQVYVLSMRGGEARQVSDLPVGVYGLQWLPDGQRIAFAANILPEYEGDWDKLRKLQEDKRNSKVTAKVTENNMYRFWDRWLTDDYVSRLFTIDINNGEVVDLMPDNGNFFGLMGGVSYDISPDGSTIAVSKNSTQPPFATTNHDIYLVPTDGSGALVNITPDNPANDVNPVFSPDGRYILYGRQSIYHFYADRVVMVLYDTRDGSHTELTADIDLSMGGWFWSDNGRTIYFIAEDRAMQSIFSIPAGGGRHTELFRSGTNSGASLAGSRHLVFLHHNLSAPPEIYRLDLRRGEAEKLTSFNDDIVNRTAWGEIENVTYSGANGADVQMFINYPPDYDPSKKYPLVMMIHGGPHGIFGDSFHFRWNSQLFAAPGYIVALPNFHGSTSFGQDFVISIHGSHADLPFRDIMKAADYLIERGLVDETRMAAAGGSYGGYMVSWIAGHTDRFACLINHAGVYDLHLQFASDFSANRAYQYGGSPWENPEQMNAANPSQFAHNFSSPMLVIHGELDYRVPVAHGFLVYNIYKNMGLEARLVYYPDENHWILTPQNSLFWYEEFYAWLERWLH